MPYDPVTGKYTLTPPVRGLTRPDYLAPYVAAATADGGGAQGGRGGGDQSLGTPGNPGVTQSTGDMARDTMALASSMFGAPSYGQVAGTVLGAMAGLPGVGVIGAMGDRALGISRGAREGDPVAARIGSGVPSQQLAGALAQGRYASGAPIAGSWLGMFDAKPENGAWADLGGTKADQLGPDYAGGNYGGSMDKGNSPAGPNDGAGKGGTGANDPTWAARGGVLRRRYAGGGPVGALRMGSIHTPSLPRAPAGPRLPRAASNSAQVLRRMAPRRYMTG